MQADYLALLREHFADPTITVTDIVQSLWSNYGHIARVQGSTGCFIVKHVDLTKMPSHPRGWHGEASHQRKLSSYKNEQQFYRNYARDLNQHYQHRLVAEPLFSVQSEKYMTLAMTDLDQIRLAHRVTSLTSAQAEICLAWLAKFHSYFLDVSTDDLWRQGNYWHINTRQQEYQQMPVNQLRTMAFHIDFQLRSARFQTLVHGDAKVTNFCFDKRLTQTAAVDFQYCGRGVGVIDLMYFLGSCFNETQLQRHYVKMVNYYFQQLRNYSKLSSAMFDSLEQEWRRLLPFAWADFERFLQGWSPEHQKLHQFSHEQTKFALIQLNAKEKSTPTN